MVKFYIIQIKRGKIAIEDVPEKWKNKVIEALEREE